MITCLSIIIVIIAFVAYDSVHAAPDLSQYPFLGSIPFDCTGNTDWVIQAGIGSTNTNYPMRLDTSTNVTWVAGPKCATGDFCTQHRSQEYNPAGSSTSVNRNFTETHNFDPGQSIAADVYNDNLFVGPVEYVGQPLDVAYNVNGFQNVGFVGSIGIGGSLVNTTVKSPRYSSNTTYTSTTRRRMRRDDSADISMSGTAPAPAYENRNPDKRDVGETCEYFYGYSPDFVSGEIAWVNVSKCACGSPEFWRVDLKSVNVGNIIAFYNMPTTVASFDSTVEYILAPKYYLDQIHNALGAQQNPSSGNFEYTCRGMSALTLSLQGYNISIPAAAWAVQNGNTCYLKIGENQGQFPTEWRLGRVYMKLLTHLFNKATLQVGIAHPAQDVIPGIEINAS
ncbi:acid protease [Backusella circina FSU 941]|nr:acid protease [Backusella circina FSU 941]